MNTNYECDIMNTSNNKCIIHVFNIFLCYIIAFIINLVYMTDLH